MMPVMPSGPAGRMRLAVLLLICVSLAWVYQAQCIFLFTRLPVFYFYLCYSPREGDVVFQSLPHDGKLVDAIEGITHSPYSHCGVVLHNDKNEWVVIESIVDVHETPLFLWELRGRGGSFTAYRFESKYSAVIPAFKEKLLSYLGRPYDYDYDMAHDQAIYCSDLVYLAFEKVTGEKTGKLEKLGELDWKPYETFIKSEAGSLPLNRLMITPASLAAAPQLHEVYPHDKR